MQCLKLFRTSAESVKQWKQALQRKDCCYVFKLKVKRNRHLVSSEIFYCIAKLSSTHLLSSNSIRGEISSALVIFKENLVLPDGLFYFILIFVGNLTHFCFLL